MSAKASTLVFDKSHGRDWPATVVLTIVHAMALFAVARVALVGVSIFTIITQWVVITLSAIAIGAGYHRYYAHANRKYQAHPLMEWFYLFFGAAAWQTSAKLWSTKHRLHHAHPDKDADPYGMNHGFWWAHVGWILWKRPEIPLYPLDLTRNKRVTWQDRYFYPLALMMGFVFPTIIGYLWHDVAGSFWLCFLRLTLQWHFTFCVNSLAHYWGDQDDPKCSARNAAGVRAFFISLITAGEGGKHSKHHKDPTNPKISDKWWIPDLSYWWIRSMELFGLVRLAR